MADSLPDSFLDNLKVEITAKLATTQSLLDRLDTSAWDAKDLEVFDTLVAEKRQSEKDHHKMQSAISRHGRQVTPADLKVAAADWRYDTETAGYVFVGNRYCTLDRSTGQHCHHEICKEAKVKEGVSYLEYDTIIHYSQRIANAKTSRMRNALRKQRDIQLTKDKETGEEWRDKAVKKFKYLGKNACDALLAIAQQLDKTVTLPLMAPPERPDTVTERLGRTLSGLRVNMLTAEANQFKTAAMRMLAPQKTVDSSTQSWRDHSNLFDFFKNIEYAHIEGAMMNVRDVMALNCKMTYELDYELRAFLEELHLLMAILDRDVRTEPGLTVQAGLVQALNEIRKEDDSSTEPKIVWPKSYLYYALRQCLIIDTVVKEKLLKVADANPVLVGQKLKDALQKARDRASSKSPLPSITKEVSEYEFQRCQQRGLIHHIIDTLNSASKKDADEAHQQRLQLHHRLSNMFEHQMLTQGFTKYKAGTRQLGEALHEYKKGREYQDVMNVIDEAQKATLQAFNEAKRKEQTEMDDMESNLKQIQYHLRTPSFIVEELPGVKREESVSLILKYAEVFYRNEEIHTAVKPFLSRGVCEFFLAFQTMGISDESFPDASYVDGRDIQHLAENLELHLNTFTKDGDGLEAFLYDRYSEGWCIAKIMVRLTIILSRLSAYNPLTAKCILGDMARLLEMSTLSLPASWLPCFRIIVEGILYTYGHLMLEATRVFGRADIDQFVLSCIWILVLHAMISSSPLDGVKQFTRAWQFVQQVLGLKEDQEWTKHVKSMFEEIIDFSEIRCANPRVCESEAERLEDRFRPLPRGIENEPIISYKSRLSSADTTLTAIVDSEDLDALAAARVLKFIASRINAMPVATPTAQGLEYLWYAFIKAESKIGRSIRCHVDAPDASSMQLVMHNGCNIWELFASREKFHGFIEGHRLGYRTQDDLDAILRSLVYYTFSHGSNARATRKVQKLFAPTIYSGPVFRMFKQRLQDLELLFTGTTTEDKSRSLEAQMYVNRLDHLLATGMCVQNIKYLTVLQQYCSIVFGDDAEISQLVSSTLGDLNNGLIIPKEDPRLESMARIWNNLEAEHIDIVYSDDESDTDSDCEDIRSFVLQTPGITESDVESIGKVSSNFEAQSDSDGHPVSCSPDGRPGPPQGRLRPVSGIAEPVLSTINATAHTKKRSKIVIETPNAAYRGRDTVPQILQSRSVRDRSPTPFPRLPQSLKIFEKSDPMTYDSPARCEHSPPATKLHESAIPELLVEILDGDEPDLSDFSPFETPEEGEVPIFCSLLSPNSTLLDQIHDLRHLACHMKMFSLKEGHPLRAMLSSTDEVEKQRTQDMFDKLHALETQMRGFQESLGVYKYTEEKWDTARFAAVKSTTKYDTDSTSTSDTDEECEQI